MKRCRTNVTSRLMVAAVLAGSVAVVGTAVRGGQTTPQQPAQPEKTPRPQNPQPQNPPNPAPAPKEPGKAPGQPGNEKTPVERDARARYARPFMFQSPQTEAKFNDHAQRLVRMEQRMEQTNKDLLRRLGEARQLTGERQSAAVLDILQQVLREREEMQKYLVFSRTGWTGEMAGTDEATPVEEPRPAAGAGGER